MHAQALQVRQIDVQDMGRIAYADAWVLQRQLLDAIVAIKVANRARSLDEQQPTPNYLLLCEHPPVYTLGKSGSAANLLRSQEELAAEGVSFYPIDRGGDITYHGPGQLVGYPILDLENFFTDIARYLRLLEEAIIRTLADYGLTAGRIPGLTGVWLGMDSPQKRKIAALGVKCSRWVTMHGFAFNIATDLSYFEGIVPCGIADPDKGVTSLSQELGRPVTLAEVQPKLLTHLAACFEAAFVPATSLVG